MTKKIIENWAKAQKAGSVLPCPRCGKLNMKEDLYSNALSRRADVYICDSCGTREDIEDLPYGGAGQKRKLETWFAVKTVFSQVAIEETDGGFELTVEQKIKLTKQDIDDIMVCALEGGVNYWCDEAKVPEDRRVADWGHEQIARGGVLLIHDSEEDEVYELTLQKFLNGFKLWVDQGRDFYGAVSDGDVDCCNIDAACADEIIQLALFNEIIYG